MNSIRLKKGYDLNMAGRPSTDVAHPEPPDTVAVLPVRIPFIKPRLNVRPGDHVNTGSLLFTDKRNPEIKFLSPGGGEISDIQYGPRRIIEAVVIRLDKDEVHEDFTAIPKEEIPVLKRKKLVNALLDGGMWPVFRELPYRNIPRPDQDIPPIILVCMGPESAFHPRPEIWLRGKLGLFRYGVEVLRKLGKRIIISIPKPDAYLLDNIGIDDMPDVSVAPCTGTYPVNDPGIMLYHIRHDKSENRSWYVNGQDLLLMAELLKSGRYPVERLVTVGGPGAIEPAHIRTRLGAPVDWLAKGRKADIPLRHVAGGPLNGYTVSEDGYLGFYETALTLIPEGRIREFLGFARPGLSRPSRSRTFLSVFRRAPFEMDCRTNGETRACVNCSSCANVCPVDLLPQFIMKALHADEIEEALAHGMLDCVECGLCTYVCPSKVELFRIIKDAKAAYYKEIAS